MLERLQQAAMAAEGNLPVTVSLNEGGGGTMVLHMADALGVLTTYGNSRTFIPWTSIKFIKVGS